LAEALLLDPTIRFLIPGTRTNLVPNSTFAARSLTCILLFEKVKKKYCYKKLIVRPPIFITTLYTDGQVDRILFLTGGDRIGVFNFYDCVLSLMFCAVIWHNGLNDDDDDHDDSWPVGLRYIPNLRRLCHRNKQRSESACIHTTDHTLKDASSVSGHF